MTDSVYIMEHFNHYCTVEIFSPNDESGREWMHNKSIWFERLGSIRSTRFADAKVAAMVARSSRPMLLLFRERPPLRTGVRGHRVRRATP